MKIFKNSMVIYDNMTTKQDINIMFDVLEKLKYVDEKIKCIDEKINDIKIKVDRLSVANKTCVTYAYQQPSIKEIKGCVIYDTDTTVTIAFRKLDGKTIKFVEIP